MNSFFFLFPRDPLAPHSFPTRRSSDLLAPRVCRRVTRPGKRPVKAIGSTLPDTSAQFPPPDRKSTRLNSSHLVISYAVFCLKKKKTAIIFADAPTAELDSITVQEP